MTIAGWIILVVISVFVILAELAMVYPSATTRTGRAISIVITVVVILALLFGMLWYFNNTTSGQRALVDQKSELGGGLDRTVTFRDDKTGTIAIAALDEVSGCAWGIGLDAETAKDTGERLVKLAEKTLTETAN